MMGGGPLKELSTASAESAAGRAISAIYDNVASCQSSMPCCSAYGRMQGIFFSMIWLGLLYYLLNAIFLICQTLKV